MAGVSQPSLPGIHGKQSTMRVPVQEGAFAATLAVFVAVRAAGRTSARRTGYSDPVPPAPGPPRA